MGMWALTRHRAVQGRRQGGQWAADHLDATNSIVLMLTIQVYKNAVFDPLKSENDPLPPPYPGGPWRGISNVLLLRCNCKGAAKSNCRISCEET